MTTSQESSRKVSLEMKSEVHYKKAAKSYRKSQQYIKMINLYPTLQNTLIDCICLPDKFIDQDTPFNMYSIANMNSENIVTRILKKLNIKKNLTKV